MSCATEDASGAAVSEQAIIFGKDDRLDLYAEPVTARRELAARSVLALLKPTRLRFAPEGDVRVAAPALEDMDDYCSSTRFLHQPSAASCGATLIDSDLILTAAHCLRNAASCRDFAFVLGYAQSQPARLAQLSREGLYSCRAVAVQERKGTGTKEILDYAIFQLDRTVSGEPVDIRPSPDLTPGEALSVIGFPNGLPVKLDSGARAADVRASLRDSFTLTSDTFQGSSGAGVFDASLALTGVFSSGVADVEWENGCASTRVEPEDARPNESATYASRAVDALCARGWPSDRLCGISPRCGDGICSVHVEDAQRCPDDCPSPRCGDLLCERTEWSDCPEDCGDRRPARVPDTFYCDPDRYADGVCDCDCGALDDDCTGGARCQRQGPRARPVPAPPVAAGCSMLGSATAHHQCTWLAVLGAVIVARRRRSPR